MALSVQQQVLRLQVSIDDGSFVQILQGQDNFGCVEAAEGSGEIAHGAKVGEKLASRNIVQQHVEVFFVVAGPVPELLSIVVMIYLVIIVLFVI